MNYSGDLVSLCELGEIVSGSTPDTQTKEYWEGGTIPWITPADLTEHEGIYFSKDLRKITSEGYKSCSTKMLPSGSILYSSRAPMGPCAVTTVPLCTNQGFKSLIPNQRLNSVYGYFALKHLTPNIVAKGRGATFLEISKEIFESIQIPLPPLPEQQRIAAILQKADRLRRLRRYARRLSDTYMQSVFLEVFGELKSSPNKLKILELSEVCKRITDGTHQPPKWSDKGVPFLFVSNVVDGELDFRTKKFISIETWNELNNRCPVEINDILYTIVGSYGVAAIVKTSQKFSFQRHIAHIKPDPRKIDPEFLLTMMNSPFVKSQADLLVNGVAQKTLNLKELQTIEIIIPEKEIQGRFVSILHRYEALRKQQKESERQAEYLFQSLLQRAFQGEL